MGKTKRHSLGTVKFDPSYITKDRGHDYGMGRPIQVHRKHEEKRSKQKLRKELNTW